MVQFLKQICCFIVVAVAAVNLVDFIVVETRQCVTLQFSIYIYHYIFFFIYDVKISLCFINDPLIFNLQCICLLYVLSNYILVSILQQNRKQIAESNYMIPNVLHIQYYIIQYKCKHIIQERDVKGCMLMN